MCYSNNSRMDTRSRYHRRKCCGMRVEKACYVFAIVNVILVCLSWFVCVGTLGFLLTRFLVAWSHMNFSQLIPELAIVYLVYAVICVGTAICGVLAVLLLQGIRKNKPKLIMAYLYFGLVLETMMIIITATYFGIILIATIRDAGQTRVIEYGGLALAICICVFYGMILYLVRSTYLVLLSRSKTQNFVDEHTVLHVFGVSLR